MTDTRRDVAERNEAREWRLKYAYRAGYRIALEADRRIVILDGPTEHDWTTLSQEDSDRIARLLREPSEGREPDADDLVCRECEAERISLCLDCFDKGGIFGTPSDSPTG